MDMKNKRSHPLAAKIKKIMQSDKDVGRVAQYSPFAIERALELFMQSLCNELKTVADRFELKHVGPSHLYSNSAIPEQPYVKFSPPPYQQSKLIYQQNIKNGDSVFERTEDLDVKQCEQQIQSKKQKLNNESAQITKTDIVSGQGKGRGRPKKDYENSKPTSKDVKSSLLEMQQSSGISFRSNSKVSPKPIGIQPKIPTLQQNIKSPVQNSQGQQLQTNLNNEERLGLHQRKASLTNSQGLKTNVHINSDPHIPQKIQQNLSQDEQVKSIVKNDMNVNNTIQNNDIKQNIHQPPYINTKSENINKQDNLKSGSSQDIQIKSDFFSGPKSNNAQDKSQINQQSSFIKVHNNQADKDKVVKITKGSGSQVQGSQNLQQGNKQVSLQHKPSISVHQLMTKQGTKQGVQQQKPIRQINQQQIIKQGIQNSQNTSQQAEQHTALQGEQQQKPQQKYDQDQQQQVQENLQQRSDGQQQQDFNQAKYNHLMIQNLIEQQHKSLMGDEDDYDS